MRLSVLRAYKRNRVIILTFVGPVYGHIRDWTRLRSLPCGCMREEGSGADGDGFRTDGRRAGFRRGDAVQRRALRWAWGCGNTRTGGGCRRCRAPAGGKAMMRGDVQPALCRRGGGGAKDLADWAGTDLETGRFLPDLVGSLRLSRQVSYGGWRRSPCRRPWTSAASARCGRDVHHSS